MSSVHDPVLRSLARLAVTTPVDLSPTSRSAIATRVTDAVACAWIGRRSPATARAVTWAAERPGPVPLWVGGMPVETEAAILANGVAVHALDFNDTYFSAEAVHPSDAIPCLYSVAVAIDATMKDYFEAIGVAYEAAILLCDGAAISASGLDHTWVTALAASCGMLRLLAVDEASASNALALVAVSRLASRATRSGPIGMWKAFAEADACAGAFRNVELAMRGVDGPPAPFVGQDGVLSRFAPTYDLEALRYGPPQISGSAVSSSVLKAWPAGHVGQSAIEATMAALEHTRSETPVAATVWAPDEALAIMSTPSRWEPSTRETADHSIPFLVASTITFGDFGPDSYSSSKFNDAAVFQLIRSGISVVSAREADPPLPPGCYRVTLHYSDEADAVGETCAPRGAASRGLQHEIARNKLEDSVRPDAMPVAEDLLLALEAPWVRQFADVFARHGSELQASDALF